jgi:hypothetical protein
VIVVLGAVAIFALLSLGALLLAYRKQAQEVLRLSVLLAEAGKPAAVILPTPDRAPKTQEELTEERRLQKQRQSLWKP